LKALVSILLFGLLFFNMMGFSVYNILGSDERENQKIASIENDLLLKFPLAMPYLNNWHHTDPTDEELLTGNEYYKIVSKQIVNDTLYVHCQFSQTARERFWSLVSTFDDEANNHAHSGLTHSILKNFLKEYMAIGRKHTFYFFEWPVPVSYQFIAQQPGAIITNLQTPPPDLL
jgi:hypothetical protein